jgi:hypothetical protein
MSKATGACSRRNSRMSSRAKESLPPERQTMTLSPALDHVEVGDRLADFAAQALGQLVVLEGGLLRLAGGRRRFRLSTVRS